MRVLHFSDVHIGVSLGAAPLRAWLGKRALGGVNLLRGRAKRFAGAREKLRALARLAHDQSVDLVIFTGDYTALGLEAEFVAARAAVEPLMGAPHGFVNVPGNHDLYVPDVVRETRFERHFGDTLTTDMPEHLADGPWPLVRLIGDTIAVVAVNSARPNPLLWRSSGKIPDAQLTALAAVLRDERVRSRHVFVITHYAPRLANGKPDTHLHGLLNADALIAACAPIERGALLCGHVHRRYRIGAEGMTIPIFCAGSATMDGHEGLWLFDVAAAAVRATPGRWDGNAYELVP